MENPYCKCGRLMRKNGTYQTKKHGLVQKFLCVNCGHSMTIQLRKVKF